MPSISYLFFIISVALLVISGTSAVDEKPGNLRLNRSAEKNGRNMEDVDYYNYYDDDNEGNEVEILGADDDDDAVIDYYDGIYGE
jgi:hypothetical protein